jgi:CheY-like chemotaxis protein
MKADEKKLELRSVFAEGLSTAYLGDPSRLAQILINLVGNSIKFTDQGFVEIKVEVKSALQGTHELLFSVTDTGIGIPAEKLPTIFESFTQAESDTSRKFGGTGLGLTICKQLVEMQSGSIGVESTPGKGTRFYFSIPYEVTDHHHKEDKKENDLESLSGINILLAEDNDFNKIVAEDTINEYLKDVIIDHAPNGKRAVEMVMKGDYDLVLMDIQMPEMDGYEAMKTIRGNGESKRSTPMIAMTANATPEEIKKCFDSGADGYVSKPFVPEDLFHQISVVLKRRKG